MHEIIIVIFIVACLIWVWITRDMDSGESDR